MPPTVPGDETTRSHASVRAAGQSRRLSSSRACERDELCELVHYEEPFLLADNPACIELVDMFANAGIETEYRGFRRECGGSKAASDRPRETSGSISVPQLLQEALRRQSHFSKARDVDGDAEGRGHDGLARPGARRVAVGLPLATPIGSDTRSLSRLASKPPAFSYIFRHLPFMCSYIFLYVLSRFGTPSNGASALAHT